MADRHVGGIGLGGILVIVGIILAILLGHWWIGLIIALVGLVFFGGFAKGKWYWLVRLLLLGLAIAGIVYVATSGRVIFLPLIFLLSLGWLSPRPEAIPAAQATAERPLALAPALAVLQ
jgi:hypothetical protein